MKTTSKLLSMLLVIVMCLSLFGTSAYASGLDDAELNGGMIEEEIPGGLNGLEEKKEIIEEKIPVFGELNEELKLNSLQNTPPSNTGDAAQIQGSSKTYASLTDAIEAAGTGSTIYLLRDIDLTKPMQINKSVTINLAGHSINMNGNQFVIGSSVVIKNGSLSTGGGQVASAGSSLSLMDIWTDSYEEPNSAFVPAGYHVVGSAYNWRIEAGSDNISCSISANEYKKNSGATVVVTMSDKVAAASEFYIYRNSGSYIKLNNNQNCLINGNTITLKSLLDDLTIGETYYFAYRDNSGNHYMYDGLNNKLYLNIKPEGSTGDLRVSPYVKDTWKSGQDPLTFEVDPYPGTKYIRVYVDNVQLSNLDWYDYQDGFFYLGKNYLGKLNPGWHTLKVKNTSWGVEGTCSFKIGATLVAVDTEKHVINSSKSLSYVCSEPIVSASMGGNTLVQGEQYTLSNNGKTITLPASFLNARSAGNTYTLRVTTQSGEEVSASVQILTTGQASSSPKTGDESQIALWAAFVIVSGAAVAVVAPKLRKNED